MEVEDPVQSCFNFMDCCFGEIFDKKRHDWILDWFNMCKCNEESIDHLLLHCPTATDLWSMMFGLFGVCWVILKTVVELLACWQGRFHHHQNGNIWLAVPHY